MNALFIFAIGVTKNAAQYIQKRPKAASGPMNSGDKCPQAKRQFSALKPAAALVATLSKSALISCLAADKICCNPQSYGLCYGRLYVTLRWL